MLLTDKQVLKIEVQSVKDFAAALNVSKSAVYTACTGNRIDYCLVAGHMLIALTTATKAYKPNESPKRVKDVPTALEGTYVATFEFKGTKEEYTRLLKTATFGTDVK